MVNPAMRPLDKKGSKEDVRDAVAFWVDIDPKEGEDPATARAAAIARLEAFELRPSVIVDSGNGVQGIWLLRDGPYIGGDIPTAKEVERFNKYLEEQFGGDHCHNCDRILRLPFTINWPNAKKRAAGRRLCPCSRLPNRGSPQSEPQHGSVGVPWPAGRPSRLRHRQARSR